MTASVLILIVIELLRQKAHADIAHSLASGSCMIRTHDSLV